MSDKHVIAVDLGAESGRVIKVRFDGKQFAIEEVHRFPNIPVKVLGTLHWDALRLWHEIKTGIEQAANGASSVGLDGWGVDFALLDRDGRLLANPVHYRDSRTEGMMEWVFERVPRRTVFERTGIQFMTLNTLYQLASLACNNSPLLEGAATFLMIPDLFNYWLSGTLGAEFTDATTTQFYNPRTRNWDWETLTALGLPTKIFPTIIQPGTRLGTFKGLPVIAPACHDTGSAVVAVPTTTADYAYCSSGTWSLFGLEVNEAVINDAAYEGNVTNEGGVSGTFRLLKNVAGMWLAQQCRVTWQEQGTDYGYDQLTAEAKTAEPFRSMVDPDDPVFLPPGDMPARIREFCRRTGQPEPETVGQVMRTVYESLALKYRLTLDTLISITGRTVERLHVIGGGSRNGLLNQMTADALGRPVIAGPGEATALGNAVVQFIALGELGSVEEGREILSHTVGTEHFEPQQTAVWIAAYGRYLELLSTL
jgi:rhamnulokinase